MGSPLSSVAAASHAVSVGELVDRVLRSGADRVAGLLFRRLLLCSDTEAQIAESSRGKDHHAGSVCGAGALRTGWAGVHWLLVTLAPISGAAVGEEVG